MSNMQWLYNTYICISQSTNLYCWRLLSSLGFEYRVLKVYGVAWIFLRAIGFNGAATPDSISSFLRKYDGVDIPVLLRIIQWSTTQLQRWICDKGTSQLPVTPLFAQSTNSGRSSHGQGGPLNFVCGPLVSKWVATFQRRCRCSVVQTTPCRGLSIWTCGWSSFAMKFRTTSQVDPP